MESLNNLIGILGTEDPKPTSGRYINELAGMSSELLEHINGPDQATYKEVWEKVKTRSASKFAEDLEQTLADKLNFETRIYETSGFNYGRSPLFFSTPEIAGVLVDIENAQKYDVFIDKISFFSQGEHLQQTPVFVNMDGMPVKLKTIDGEEFNFTPVDVKAGFNEIIVNALVQTESDAITLFFGFDLSEMAFANLEIGANQIAGSTVTAAVLEGVLPLGKEAYFYDDFSEDTDRGPVLVSMHIDCSLNKLVARNKKAFTQAYMNLLGAEVLREKIHSPRTNFWASGNLALSQENMKYLEIEYKKALSKAVKKLSEDQICMNCEGYSTITYETENLLP